MNPHRLCAHRKDSIKIAPSHRLHVDSVGLLELGSILDMFPFDPSILSLPTPHPAANTNSHDEHVGSQEGQIPSSLYHFGSAIKTMSDIKEYIPWSLGIQHSSNLAYVQLATTTRSSQINGGEKTSVFPASTDLSSAGSCVCDGNSR